MPRWFPTRPLLRTALDVAQLRRHLGCRLLQALDGLAEERRVVLTSGGETERQHAGRLPREVEDGGRDAHQALDHLVDLDGIAFVEYPRQSLDDALAVEYRVRRVVFGRVPVEQAIDLSGRQTGEKDLPDRPVVERAHRAHLVGRRDHGEPLADALPLVDRHAVVAVAHSQYDGGARSLFEGLERSGRRLKKRGRGVDQAPHLEEPVSQSIPAGRGVLLQ